MHTTVASQFRKLYWFCRIVIYVFQVWFFFLYYFQHKNIDFLKCGTVVPAFIRNFFSFNSYLLIFTAFSLLFYHLPFLFNTSLCCILLPLHILHPSTPPALPPHTNLTSRPGPRVQRSYPGHQ